MGRKDPGVTGEGAWGESDPGWTEPGVPGVWRTPGWTAHPGVRDRGAACLSRSKMASVTPAVPCPLSPHPPPVRRGPAPRLRLRTPHSAHVVSGPHHSRPGSPAQSPGLLFSRGNLHNKLSIIQVLLTARGSRGDGAGSRGGGGCQGLGLWLLMDSILYGPPSLHTWGGGDGLPTPSTIPGVQTGQDFACRVQTRENTMCFNTRPALQTLAMY